METNNKKIECSVCKKLKYANQVIKADKLKSSIKDTIKRENPEFDNNSYICIDDLNHYRKEHIDEILEIEKGGLTSLENEVAKSIEEEEILSKNVDSEFDSDLSIGSRIADKVAEFGGSWKFIISFMTILFTWILINTIILSHKPFDPYPFILLNLILSCVAAIQAPVIMMSQNRQEAKDRMRSEHDYQVNLKAEIEIRHLNEKIDFLTHQIINLMETQEMQMEALEDLMEKKR